jgi:hypothetical protein
VSGSVEAVPPFRRLRRVDRSAVRGAPCGSRGKSRSSVSWIAAFRSPASRRGRGLAESGLAWEWRRNGLERLNPRPEMVWPPAGLDSQYLVQGRGPRPLRCKHAFKAKAGYEAATSAD